MEEDIENYSPTGMCRGTPCILKYIISIGDFVHQANIRRVPLPLWIMKLFFKRRLTSTHHFKQTDSSTIDGNVEFVRSQYSCILTSQVSIQFLCPTKLLIIVILDLTVNNCNFMCSLFSYLILENMFKLMWENFLFLCYIWHLWRRVQLVLFSVATYCTW